MSCPYCGSDILAISTPRQPVIETRPPGLLARLFGHPGYRSVGFAVTCCVCRQLFAYTTSGAIISKATQPQKPRTVAPTTGIHDEDPDARRRLRLDEDVKVLPRV